MCSFIIASCDSENPEWLPVMVRPLTPFRASAAMR